MKQNFIYIFTLALAFTLCSCGHKSANKVVPAEKETTATVAVEEDDESGLSHFSDTLTHEQYHQMILEAIANGDKQMFAKMVSYPLWRRYPLPDIENEEQMVRYFDTLFDKQFRQQIAKLDSNSWDYVGWRGAMILHGKIWDTGSWIIVNYSSPLEQRHAEYLKKKDMARLHPSLRGNWEPYDCYRLDGKEFPDFEYSYARVDASTDHNPEDFPTYRVAVFKKGSNASDPPAIVLLGERTLEGSMHIETLYFKSDEYDIFINPKDVEDEKSYFSIRKGNESVRRVPCKKCMQPF